MVKPIAQDGIFGVMEMLEMLLSLVDDLFSRFSGGILEVNSGRSRVPASSTTILDDWDDEDENDDVSGGFSDLFLDDDDDDDFSSTTQGFSFGDLNKLILKFDEFFSATIEI